jgi:hypothetical protein
MGRVNVVPYGEYLCNVAWWEGWTDCVSLKERYLQRILLCFQIFFFDTSIMKPCQDLSSQAPVAPFPYICKHYSCKSPAFQICMRMKISSEISNRHMQCFGLGWFAFPHQGPA